MLQMVLIEWKQISCHKPKDIFNLTWKGSYFEQGQISQNVLMENH